MSTSPLPFQGPKKGRKCYVNLALSGVLNTKCAEKIRSAYLTHAFLGARKRVVHSQGSPTPSAGRKSEVPTSALPCERTRRGRKCSVSHAFSGVPNAKRGGGIGSGCLTPAFFGAQNKVEVLCDPCTLMGPQHQARGENHRWLPHPCLLGGVEEGGAFSGVPNGKRGEKITGRCLTPAFSGA